MERLSEYLQKFSSADIKAIPFEDAYKQFLHKMFLYGLETEFLAAVILVTGSTDIPSLTDNQRLLVMLECRDVLIEAEWFLNKYDCQSKENELYN